MRLPTSDQTLSTPVIGAIAGAIVVLLLLALLALRAGADDEVDLTGAPAASETALDDRGPTAGEGSAGDPATATQTTGTTPDAGARPSAPPAPAATDAPADPVATPTVPLGEADTGPAAVPPAGGSDASDGAGPTDGGDGEPAQTGPVDGTLPPGTCIEDDGRAPDVGSATPVDCDVSHTGEVFATTTVQLPPDAAYPGADALEHDTRGLCQGPAFQEYVGTPHDDSALFTYALFPTEASWAAGDRAIACVAFHPMERTEGSVRGSGR